MPFSTAQQSEPIMSQFSKVKRSRDQWKRKAKDRGDQNRYQRKQLARLKAERDRATEALKRAHNRLGQLEQERQRPPSPCKVDLVWIALQLVLVARLGFRAASRVLRLLAPPRFWACAKGLVLKPSSTGSCDWPSSGSAASVNSKGVISPRPPLATVPSG